MPYWMWMGKVPARYNATPSRNLTATEAENLVGYEAAGCSEIRPVDMVGRILNNNLQTTFNPTYGNGSAYGGARMTTAINAGIEIYDLDANGNEVLVGTLTGFVVQMNNGDMFFRPTPGQVATWSSDIDSIYAIRVVSTTLILDSTAINPAVGFNPDIVDLISGDGIVDGTSGNDVIGAGYIDHNDGEIDGNDNTDAAGGVVNSKDDVVRGSGGNDNISSGDGNGADTVYGSAGNDVICGFGDTIGGADDHSADYLDGGSCDDKIFGGGDNDTLLGDAGSYTLYSGDGNDVLDGGAGRDLITDFGAGNFDPIDDDNTNNDFVDLTAFYNETTLAAWNAAYPGNTCGNPLAWLRADQADGVLREAGGLRIQNGGVAVVNTELTKDSTGVVCFASGTLIRISLGEVPVEELNCDLHSVLTADCGYLPLRWSGGRKLSASDLRHYPNLRPIRILAGALGPCCPEQDLIVSPQHRILVGSRIVENMSSAPTALVAARHQTDVPGIAIADDLDEIEYWHFLFDDHQLVWSNGAISESLYTGKEALKTLVPAARQEVFALFPELEPNGRAPPRPVRTLLSGREARELTRRHARNAVHLAQTRLARPGQVSLRVPDEAET